MVKQAGSLILKAVFFSSLALMNFQLKASAAPRDITPSYGDWLSKPDTNQPIRVADRPSTSSLYRRPLSSEPLELQPLPPVEPASRTTEKAVFTPDFEPDQPIFVVQAGAFSSYENAERMVNDLSAFGRARIKRGFANGSTVYRVQLGGWYSRPQAKPLLDMVRNSGFDAFIATDS